MGRTHRPSPGILARGVVAWRRTRLAVESGYPLTISVDGFQTRDRDIVHNDDVVAAPLVAEAVASPDAPIVSVARDARPSAIWRQRSPPWSTPRSRQPGCPSSRATSVIPRASRVWPNDSSSGGLGLSVSRGLWRFVPFPVRRAYG